MNTAKWSAMAATGLAGIVAGSLTFVSAVDTRSFLQHVTNDRTDLILSHFGVWWPYGRDWMVPLLFSTSVAHAVAYGTTKDKNWALSGILIMLVGPYTKVVLMEDITTLRKADATEVKETITRFCKLHHVRLVLAMVGLGLSLVGLAEM
jgi:Domain of unknown function (DUF1772)